MIVNFVHRMEDRLAGLPSVQNKRMAGRLMVNLFFLVTFPIYGQQAALLPAPGFVSTAASPLAEQPVALNQPPNASFSFNPTRPVKHYPLTLDGTASTDPDGVIARYDWDLGDGNTNSTTTPTITHTYDSTATVIVTLRVTDDLGAIASFSLSVTISSSNSFPVAAFTASPSTPFVGDTLTFNGTRSWDPDIDGRIASYLWLFGDGTYSSTANMTLHSYASSGLYEITVIVTDNSGAAASTAHAVYVLAGLTVAVFSDRTQGAVPLLVSLHAQASGGQGPYTFSWAFGDGDIAQGQASLHNYTQSGTYHAQVEATDSTGHVIDDDLIISVTDGATTPEGQLDFGVDPVLYALNGIGISALGLTVLLLVYAFTLRRGRRTTGANEGEIKRANMRLSTRRRFED